MYLVRLIYASEVSESFQPSDIESILRSARTNNSKLGLTGLLCFDNVYFLQCLEGSRAAINDMYVKILKDPRHKHVLLLSYGEIIERDFSQWSMGFVSASQLNSVTNLKFSATPGFNPYEMNGESCRRLMVALKDTVTTVG